ncbi:DUF1294 domain-containing protein [Clostridium sp. SYSU_GA19001]|uniref:DUF1294 domain-containing protein n=1 Tax=Clostridium caldaquaticum TaxID=2940653 RepID=UPI002076FA6D|nr:DUF1294 domain-containing protein [Clostridium caldaquaticum]MCM8711482.1 DUF1294 domain-containing protein [Clostridium caldaquaticum]
MIIILIYLLLINSLAIFVMYSDKRKARKGYWRIPEQKLFIIALLFGSPGILIGMNLFRHKTRHFKFVYGIPIILIIQIFIIYKFLKFFY